MKKRFFVAGIVTTITNLALHAAAYFLVLKDFYRSHPAVSEEFMNQLSRKPEDLVWWAMAVTSLAMGFLITWVMDRSGAKTFLSGLKQGFILGSLFWSSVNFGLYASSNYFSAASVFVDSASSTTVMTVAGAVAAWLLGAGKKPVAGR
jgi:hypothetical protein